MEYSPAKSETLTAKIISVVLHPVFYPTLGLFFFLNSGTYLETINDDAKNYLYLVTLFSTCVLPLLSVPFFAYRRVIKGVTMESRQERIVPLVLVVIFYYTGYYFISKAQFPSVITAYISSLVIIVSVALVVTIRWKISLHLIGAGGLAGSLAALSLRMETGLQEYIIAALLISSFAATSRLILKMHSARQLLLSFLAGLIIAFFRVYFY